MSKLFDKSYWKKTAKSRPMTCVNCGRVISRDGNSSTGWTHISKNWKGIRCENQLVGAQPVGR